MKTNFTTKQFALHLRKVCADYDEEWRIGPRSGPEEVLDGTLLDELHAEAKGPWYYFFVKSGRAECGVYVGGNRKVHTACSPFDKDKIFEQRLLDALMGR